MKLYPVTCTLNVMITDGDGTSGSVAYMHAFGHLPTEAEMEEILERIKTTALPEGFRFMTRNEASMYFLRKEKGYRGPTLAMPGLEPGEEWHDPATADTPFHEPQFDEVDEEEEE